MCLGFPMLVLERDAFSARCEARGVERVVSLFLLQHETVSPGDHVMVHAGQAVRKMSETEAASTWDLLEEMLAREAETARDI
ncbi:MAG: HypC/HybG/HupF family hydrogenase formation chaperone [Oricola sp.]